MLNATLSVVLLGVSTTLLAQTHTQPLAVDIGLARSAAGQRPCATRFSLCRRIAQSQDFHRSEGDSRPHASLEDRTPSEFASQIAVNRDLAETKTSRSLTI